MTKRPKPPRAPQRSGTDPESPRRPMAASRPRNRWKHAFQNAGLTVGVVVLLLAGVEVVLRTAFDGKYGKRPAFFVPDPTLGWTINPGLDDTFYGADFRIRVRTDENGYRLGRLGAVDLHKRLVLFAGDSNVFGWGVSTEETVASYLDELVSQATGGEARVVNLGVGGYGTLQYSVRIRDFIEKHPDAKIAAVVVVHAPNDAVDNVKSVGYYFHAWKPHVDPPRERSSIHLVNLVGYAVQLAKGRRTAAGGASRQEAATHPYLQDMLFSIDTERPKTIHPELVICGRTVSFKSLSEEDWATERTLARESLTEIQGGMISASVSCIHTLLAGRDTKIFHVVVPTAPDWFADGISGVVKETQPLPDGRSGFYGRLIDPSQYGGNVLNETSAGHYTPGFNKVWAEKIFELLRSEGVKLSGQ